MGNAKIPVLGIVAAHSNSGKTTLIEKLIPLLSRRGLRIGVVKHVHHAFDMDTPGKDSYRFREAGAYQVLVGSGRRSFLEMTWDRDYPDLSRLIDLLDHDNLDIVLAEGFRRYDFPKIETTLAESSAELVCHEDAGVIAVASKQAFPDITLPQLRLDDADTVAEFIVEWLADLNGNG